MADISTSATWQRIIIAASLLLFVASLFQPAFYIDRKDYDAWDDGKTLLLLGWMSFLGGNFIASLIWLANPLYVIAILLLINHKKSGLYPAILAALLAYSFSLLGSIMTSENGNYSRISSLENGYKLWTASIFLLAIGTGCITFIQRQAGK